MACWVVVAYLKNCMKNCIKNSYHHFINDLHNFVLITMLVKTTTVPKHFLNMQIRNELKLTLQNLNVTVYSAFALSPFWNMYLLGTCLPLSSWKPTCWYFHIFRVCQEQHTYSKGRLKKVLNMGIVKLYLSLLSFSFFISKRERELTL